jgi:rubrerythrin
MSKQKRELYSQSIFRIKAESLMSKTISSEEIKEFTDLRDKLKADGKDYPGRINEEYGMMFRWEPKIFETSEIVYCGTCGRQARIEDSQKRCPSCGSWHNFTRKCFECGKELKEGYVIDKKN